MRKYNLNKNKKFKSTSRNFSLIKCSNKIKLVKRDRLHRRIYKVVPKLPEGMLI